MPNFTQTLCAIPIRLNLISKKVFSDKTIGTSKVILWYIVAVTLISIYFLIDQTGLKEFVDTADQHRPDWALVLLIVYGISKYLSGIAGLIIISVMTFMLIRQYVQSSKKTSSRN